MRQCLTSDLGGYYTSTSPTTSDQFGSKGDFVTSPEISQVFGELIGVWFVAEWIAQGKKNEGVYLMEVGPGRGTLMDDMLRTVRSFPDLAKAIEAIYMVEASPRLRKAQHKLLCGDNAMEETSMGWQSVSKHSNELKIIWTEDVRFVPKDGSKTPFIVAHEFFDALPIHAFQSVPPAPQPESSDGIIQTPTGPIKSQRRLAQASQQAQWRELLVSPKPPHRLEEGQPEFELSQARASTPHSMYLPETSSRYRALQSKADATVEISPESQAHLRDFAERIGGSNPVTEVPKPASIPTPTRTVSSGPALERITKYSPSGAALIIDYGPATSVPANSLRGIRSHKLVSPFEAPGTTDLSADVDFIALAESALNGSPGVEAHGPVDQARFLTAMGIQERATQLVKLAVDKERGGSTGKEKGELTEKVKGIESGWKRLVDNGSEGMGSLYKVLAIVPYKPGEAGERRRRPVGFGGDIKL
ncbi:hypothetical protein B0A48_12903 [Cryoendolithus antarcticus]|uniref:Protein arginine methyltransferase NDUFAF7 n=1 Tax=Cryoendolithus antarcticus TaxID=1507870 RepID=A0A1V8SQP4_9PEZI|nr:hypothetical protein B0A48_12903 [Cryoendolithus antarcticus]